MCARWNKQYDPILLIKRFKGIVISDKSKPTIRRSQGSFSSSFSGFEFEEYSAVMGSVVSMDEKVPEIIKKRIIHDAVYQCADENNLSVKNVLGKINRQENAYLNDSNKKFYIVTTISVHHIEGMGSKRIGNLSLSFFKGLPIKFKDHYDKKYIPDWIPSTPHDYTVTLVGIKSRTDIEAVELAYDGLDFLLGVWNLSYNYRSVNISMGGQRRPKHKIVRGPLLTIHKANGRIATRRFWYRTDQLDAVQAQRIKNDWAKLCKFEQGIRVRLRRHPYSQDMRESFIRYSRAMDSSNYESSFLYLWSLLEFLTGIRGGESKTVIRRASFFFKDVDYHRLVLRHLSDFRNRAVHSAEGSHDIEHYIEQIRRYVETLIIYHIFEYQPASNLVEATEFLDFPSNSEEIKRKIRLLRKASKFT
ncbi:hypothetical protein ACFL4K_00100 [Candidatus Neomarinimicrobiota bacterium]